MVSCPAPPTLCQHRCRFVTRDYIAALPARAVEEMQRAGCPSQARDIAAHERDPAGDARSKRLAADAASDERVGAEVFHALHYGIYDCAASDRNMLGSDAEHRIGELGVRHGGTGGAGDDRIVRTSLKLEQVHRRRADEASDKGV